MAWIGDDPGLEEAPPRRRMRDVAARLLRQAVDAVLPPLCPACGTHVGEPATLCPACWSDLAFISRPFCEKTATPFSVDLGPGTLSPEASQLDPPWERARAAVLYGPTASRLVQALKYHDRHEVAPLMGRQMARAGADILAEADLVVPVPLHWRRQVARRFNQAELLARAVVRATPNAPPVAPDLLVRRKSTPRQVGLGKTQRAANMVGAFALRESDRHRVAGRRVVLVDDVFTSGATLVAAARVLKRAGAAAVDVLVFARAVETIATDAGDPI